MPVIYDDRQVLAGGRYLQQIRISAFRSSVENPEGLRYSLCLVDRMTGQIVLLYDVHRGKGHHRHLRGKQTNYAYVDPGGLIADFRQDVDLVLKGKL